VVANFTDAGATVATNYSASIAWGDNSASAGTFNANGSSVTIAGSHSYEEGSYTVTTTFSQGTLFSVIVSSSAVVSDAPLTNVSPSPLSPLQGIALSNAPVATFTDTNPTGKLSDFTATITWGDGVTSTGTVTQPGGVGTSFVVAGSHTYGVPGPETITVTVRDIGGQTAATTFVVTVAPSIFVLNPTLSGALTVSGTVSVNIGGAVVVDSNSPTALSAGGNSQITASRILVTGGVSASGGAVLAPAPVTGVRPWQIRSRTCLCRRATLPRAGR